MELRGVPTGVNCSIAELLHVAGWGCQQQQQRRTWHSMTFLKYSHANVCISFVSYRPRARLRYAWHSMTFLKYSHANVCISFVSLRPRARLRYAWRSMTFLKYSHANVCNSFVSYRTRARLRYERYQGKIFERECVH